ncbi:MAG: hypothetical protein QOF90_3259 [Acetobacteraceae bacterium]|jgi:hypothetical protein|nr:hypothetical protein [Acetobacteraceae bacterium]MEA2777853.1 hypothetical protein [Acetobacteraceae bacterium]MEA2787615.1 hypothetical protein [Acetobacteraceae bacterium]
MSADTTLDQPSTVFVRFLLDADPSPGLLPRLLQPYAKRDLVPDRMWSHRAGDTIHVEIAMEAMPAEVVHLIQGNLLQVVGVRTVSRIAQSCLRQVA